MCIYIYTFHLLNVVCMGSSQIEIPRKNLPDPALALLTAQVMRSVFLGCAMRPGVKSSWFDRSVIAGSCWLELYWLSLAGQVKQSPGRAIG